MSPTKNTTVRGVRIKDEVLERLGERAKKRRWSVNHCINFAIEGGRMDCKFESCSAPICPLDEQSMKKSIWYPDEDICHKRLGLQWIKIQRRIKKKAKNKDRYFTRKDFDVTRVQSPRGHNPDTFRDTDI